MYETGGGDRKASHHERKLKFFFLKEKELPFYTENNSVSTTQIRLQKVIECLGLRTF
jgi:hypothetical protein